MLRTECEVRQGKKCYSDEMIIDLLVLYTLLRIHG